MTRNVDEMAGPELEVRGYLDEARIHLGDAIDVLRKAARESRENDGPYWLHGQLEAYTIPHLESWVDAEYQTGSIGGLERLLDSEPADAGR
jgi:hypothetical protein